MFYDVLERPGALHGGGKRRLTVMSLCSGGKILSLYCVVGHDERMSVPLRHQRESKAYRQDVLRIPVGVAVVKKHDHGEEHIDRELEDFKIRPTHVLCWVCDTSTKEKKT